MQERDFIYWLRGFFELSEAAETGGLTAYQTKMIKQHLDLVFKQDAPKAALGQPRSLQDLYRQATQRQTAFIC